MKRRGSGSVLETRGRSGRLELRWRLGRQSGIGLELAAGRTSNTISGSVQVGSKGVEEGDGVSSVVSQVHQI